MRWLFLVGASIATAWLAAGTPNWHGCVDEAARGLPYCDTSRGVEERLDDLLSRLSLEDKISQICPDRHTRSEMCTSVVRGVPEIGLPGWTWLVESNTNVASGCPMEGRCATTFVGEMGMGASFNRTSWRLKGSVMGTEMRALSNSGFSRFNPGSSAKIGLTAFGPNINIARDPRFGRSSELPGEDPFLSGTYAYEMVSGMQEKDAHGYQKVAAFLKHYTAYSEERLRGHDDFNISQFDFWDTYLPQYEKAFGAHPAGVMCSYNAENGRPSCANDWLLNRVLRQWQPDAMVTTDCGAVPNLQGAPANAPDAVHAVAWALMNGTDFEMGEDMFVQHLRSAIELGLATEERVNEAASRALRTHFKVGRFDPPEASEWTKFDLSWVNHTVHEQISYEAALQGLVLLKNDGGALPIAQRRKVAVLGPQGVARAGLLSDYAADQVCFNGNYHCIGTIAEGIARANVGGTTLVEQGVDVDSNRTNGTGPALDAARAADVVVLALGIDKTVEREGQDREDTALPGIQAQFARQVLALQKPTVLVLVNGGALAIDALVSRGGASENAPYAIVEAFNPNVIGGRAVGAALFGLENRWGKLPVTMYPHSYISEQPMLNYDMSKPPGRTYKYYAGTPLFPFGHGLSLTTFSLACRSTGTFRYECSVKNTGGRDGDEVVQVYHRVVDVGLVRHPLPRRALVDFARISVPAGQAATVSFALSEEAFKVVNELGARTLYPGEHALVFSRGHGEEQEILQRFPDGGTLSI